MEQKQTYGFPAFLSLILPGFGQAVKGHWKTAFIVWFGFFGFGTGDLLLVWVLFLDMEKGGGSFTPEAFFIFAAFGVAVVAHIGFWIWQIRDAYLAPNSI